MQAMRRAMMAAMLACAAPAAAQLLGGGGGLGGLGGTIGGVTGGLIGGGGAVAAGGVVGGLSGPLGGIGDAVGRLSPSDLLAQRRERLRTLLRDNRATLDQDDEGNPVRRDTILGLGLDPGAIERLRAAGYGVAARETVDGLGLSVTTLTPPRGRPARKALGEIRTLDPKGDYMLDPIYEPARAPLAPAGGPAAGGSAAGAKIGLIDGGVGGHPAFRTAAIEQRGFAGTPQPSGHGTAVASLIVGEAGAFHGAAPGASLLVADVYCGSPANGSATAIVRAMAWLAARGVRVVSISLVGPPNPLLAAGVKALQGRGIAVVAAVGNDGPAAPPQYPASYAGVIAVTGVDAKNRPLIEAGKPLHLDYAAPGADMVGAVPGGGWERLRGTSFAAPLVAARLAAAGSTAALAAEAQPASGRVGKGIICGQCRTPPAAVGLK